MHKRLQLGEWWLYHAENSLVQSIRWNAKPQKNIIDGLIPANIPNNEDGQRRTEDSWRGSAGNIDHHPVTSIQGQLGRPNMEPDLWTNPKAYTETRSGVGGMDEGEKHVFSKEQLSEKTFPVVSHVMSTPTHWKGARPVSYKYIQAVDFLLSYPI